MSVEFFDIVFLVQNRVHVVSRLVRGGGRMAVGGLFDPSVAPDVLFVTQIQGEVNYTLGGIKIFFLWENVIV